MNHRLFLEIPLKSVNIPTLFCLKLFIMSHLVASLTNWLLYSRLLGEFRSRKTTKKATCDNSYSTKNYDLPSFITVTNDGDSLTRFYLPFSIQLVYFNPKANYPCLCGMDKNFVLHHLSHSMVKYPCNANHVVYRLSYSTH